MILIFQCVFALCPQLLYHHCHSQMFMCFVILSKDKVLSVLGKLHNSRKEDRHYM